MVEGLLYVIHFLCILVALLVLISIVMIKVMVIDKQAEPKKRKRHK